MLAQKRTQQAVFKPFHIRYLIKCKFIGEDYNVHLVKCNCFQTYGLETAGLDVASHFSDWVSTVTTWLQDGRLSSTPVCIDQ
jgi:hypothetical protein